MSTEKCTHPRQARPQNRSESLPCAWPGCPDGASGDNLNVFIKRIRPSIGTMHGMTPITIGRVKLRSDDEIWFEWEIVK